MCHQVRSDLRSAGSARRVGGPFAVGARDRCAHWSLATDHIRVQPERGGGCGEGAPDGTGPQYAARRTTGDPRRGTRGLHPARVAPEVYSVCGEICHAQVRLQPSHFCSYHHYSHHEQQHLAICREPTVGSLCSTVENEKPIYNENSCTSSLIPVIIEAMPYVWT